MKISGSWMRSIPTSGLEAIVEASQPLEEHAIALTIAQQERDANVNALNQTQTTIQQLQSEISSLPAQISEALAISEQAKAAMQPALNELKAADARVSSLSSSYYSAVDTQYIITAEIVLCTFGFRTCTPGQYDSALANANATVAAYESARAAAASALARYDGYYNDYKSKYDAYASLYERREVANNELAQANLDLKNYQAVIPSLEDTLMRAHKRIDNRVLILALIPTIQSLESALRQQVKTLSQGKPAAWEKSFSRVQGTWLQLNAKRIELSKLWNELQGL